MNRSSLVDGRARDVLVSMIVPAYNPDQILLERCVTSLRKQTHARIDIVIVDDGSPPETAAWIDEIANTDPRIRVIRQDNAGVSAARNTGVSAARGQYVSFVDADDHVDPAFVASALSVLARTDADAVFGGIVIAQRDASVHWRCGEATAVQPLVLVGEQLIEPRARALTDSPSPQANSPLTSVTNVVGALYSVDAVHRASFRPGVSHAEDRLFNFEVLGAIESAAFCSDSWYFYDQTNSGSATQTVGSTDGRTLLPTVSALASMATSASSPSSDSDTALLRQAAAVGLLNYLKLLATIASAAPRSSSRATISSALAVEGLARALASATPSSPRDRIFRTFVRWRWVSGLLALGRLANRSL